MPPRLADTSLGVFEEIDLGPRTPPSGLGTGAAFPNVRLDKLTGFKSVLLEMIIYATLFMLALDNSIVAILQPSIAYQFRALDKFPWLAVGHQLGGLTAAMPLAKLYSVFDAKPLFLLFTVAFLGASALSGTAVNMASEIVGRVWAGIAVTGMRCGLLLIHKRNLVEKERHAACPDPLTIVWALGSLLGPVVGGALALASWRWAFYMNLFPILIILPVCILIVPSRPSVRQGSTSRHLEALDPMGILLSVVSMTTFAAATNLAGVLFSWKGSNVIILYAVSAICCVGFALQQTFCIFTTASNQLVPIPLLGSREAMINYFFVSCGSTMAYITTNYVPIYLELIRGASPAQTAGRTLPLGFLLAISFLFSENLRHTAVFYRTWSVFAAALGLAGAVLMSKVNVDTPTATISGYQTILGIGAGCFAHAGFVSVQTSLYPGHDTSDAALMLVAQLGGSTIGLSLAGAIFVNTAKKSLASLFPELGADALDLVMAGASGDFLSNLRAKDQALALDCIVEALRKVFIHAYAASAVAIFMGALIEAE
ncbi:hypothetical protein CDD83_4423 [Cordyceps sp. RAO-2017]|nr:hypothetical protein CDD83_4423 [Cordyceps sp. RAO-2017]